MFISSIAKKFRGALSSYRAQISVVPSLEKLECNNRIAEALKQQSPYLVGRLGWMEGYAIGKLLSEGETPLILREKLALHAGIFPPTSEQLKLCATSYLEALKGIHGADILGLIQAPYHGWLLKKYARHTEFAALDALEPYFFEEPWSEQLKGLSVLVVHPFAESIVQQYATVREKIFTSPKILPEFELKVIQAPQTITGNNTEYSSWSETLDILKKKVEREKFDVAIIGCGGYGLPLAAHIKKIGKIAIHLGGATQLLFGIRGSRWNQHPNFQKIITDAWCSPLEKERPLGWDKIEGGCYW